MIVNRVGVKVEMKNNNSGTAVGYVGISYSYVSSLKIELQSWWKLFPLHIDININILHYNI